MFKRLCLAGFVVVAAAALLASLARAQEVRPPVAPTLAKGEVGEVIMNWDTFRKITEHERAPGEPKITLPWPEVEDMLGIKVEKAEGAQLTLDWRQFRALLQWSVEQKKPKAAVAVPADFVVTSAQYAGTLRPEGAVFSLTMTVDVLKEDGWKRVPLLPATVALSAAELPAGCYLNVTGGRYELLTAGKGRLDVKLEFAAAVVEQAGVYTVRFDTVPSGTAVLKLTVAQENVNVKVAGAQAVLPLEAKKGETMVGASLPSGAPVQITWERALEKIAAVPSKLYAETRTLVAVGDGILTCRERVDLSVLHTGIRQVVLSVPKDVSVLEVTGPAVYDWRVADSKLEVRFARDVLGSSTLNLTYERAAKDEKAIQVPVFGVEEAVRDRGYVGIVALANVEVTAPEFTGATSVDVRELPSDIVQMTNQPILLAFRYVSKQFSIPLSVKRHEDVPVLVTIADSGVLTVMQTADGRRITKAIYNVRNNRKQFMRLRLPKGADVWSATVAGKSVRPALDEQGRMLIPLVRSGAGSSEFASFPVEVVYVEKQDKVAEAGQMRIELPQAGEPVTQLMVQLYLPAEGDYKSGSIFGRSFTFEGPLRRVQTFSVIASAPQPPSAQLDAAQQAQQMQEQFTKRTEAEAVAAGVTPIRVDLPIRGQMFKFEKILVFDEELWTSFQYSGWKKS